MRNKIIIYGAHLIAIELCRYIKSNNYDCTIIGFAVTSLKDNPDVLEGLPVKEITEYTADSDTTVVIAMPAKYHNEVTEYANSLGFVNILCIDQLEMERLKSEQLLKKFKSDRYFLYEDIYDKSWLNISEKIHMDVDSEIRRHFKYPTLYYISSAKTEKITSQRNLEQCFSECFGECRCIRDLKITSKNVDDSVRDILKIYMVFSQWDNGNMSQMQLPEWIVPIQAGSALTDNKSNEILDESGNNISEMNRGLAELTAAYWVWKNEHNSIYKGICHYRRHFVITEDEIRVLQSNNVNAILTTPRFAPDGVGKMFLAETPVKESVYNNMITAVTEIYPNDAELFVNYLANEFYVPNNMVVARNKVYDDYCSWMFPVIFRMMELDKENEYGHETDRHNAYAAELLTSFYFSKIKDNTNIYITDYHFGG